MISISITQKLPAYMEPGSRGAAANALLAFLAGWVNQYLQWTHGVGADLPKEKISVDGLFGTVGEQWLKLFQKQNGLEPDGGCGPDTRAALKGSGFDFEEAVMTSGGKSLFVQPDGSVVLFIAPDLPFTEHEVVVGEEKTPVP